VTSRENVEVLRDAFETFAREGVPNFEFLDPDLEIVNFAEFPVTKPYRGWDGALDWLVDMSEPFEDFNYELAEVAGEVGDHVVTTLRIRGASRTGGPEFELVWGTVWTFRDGRVVRIEGFRTKDEALEAVGLSE
jgi:ketosteroid isomerase-like protein